MRASLLRLVAPPGDECPVCHAAHESEQAVPLEREREVGEHETLECGRNERGLPFVCAIEQYGAAACHRSRDPLWIGKRHLRVYDDRERLLHGGERSALFERVGGGSRVAGASEELGHSLEEGRIGANEKNRRHSHP